MRLAWFVVVPLSLACAGGAQPPPVVAVGSPPAPPGPPGPQPPPLSTTLALDGEVIFEGMCDASGAVELDPHTFMVADDEDNVLRVYDADRGGPPLAAVDVSSGVGVAPRGKKRPRTPELDLEAATRIGDRAYWLTSHGRNSKGRLRPERLRFFATTLPPAPRAAAEVTVVASTERLLDTLLADERYAALGLAAAAERAPKAEGGLNLEGMTASPDGALLLGFRSPVPDGLAILVPIAEPERALAGEAGAVGPPVRLDLGGLGVRALTWWRGQYLIVAGHHDSRGPSRLYAWDGKGAPTLLDVELAGYNPEGTFSPDVADRLMLLSDDGTVETDGVPCKELAEHGQRHFRGVWLRATATTATATTAATTATTTTAR
jgi:hypothetical protein